jgi:hypothetical protein
MMPRIITRKAAPMAYATAISPCRVPRSETTVRARPARPVATRSSGRGVGFGATARRATPRGEIRMRCSEITAAVMASAGTASAMATDQPVQVVAERDGGYVRPTGQVMPVLLRPQ